MTAASCLHASRARVLRVLAAALLCGATTALAAPADCADAGTPNAGSLAPAPTPALTDPPEWPAPAPAPIPVPEIIIDNSDPGFSVDAPSKWPRSSSLLNSNGPDYVYALRDQGAMWAAWTPTITQAGTYGVYYWLPDGNDTRATQARYTVHDKHGDTHYPVNQQDKANAWRLLGNHEFQAGTSGKVTLTVAGSGNGSLSADAIRFGPPGPPDIHMLIRSAKLAGRSSVTLPPGEYRRSSSLSLDDLDDFTINAAGAWLVMTDPVLAIAAGDSHNLTVNGLTINYDPLPFTQGRVIEVATDHSWMKVLLHQGYPRPDAIANRVTVWDPTSRLPLAQSIGAQVSWIDQSQGLVLSTGAQVADVGDYVTFAGGAVRGTSFGITVGGTATTWQDVNLLAAPGMGFINASGDGRTHLNRFRVIPGPAPKGATERPILSTSWDAIQFQGVKQGPHVENSVVVNAGDDSMSIQGIGQVHTLEVAGNRIRIYFSDAYRQVRPGDRLQQWVDGPQVTVKSVTKVSGTVPGAPAESHVYDVILQDGQTAPWTAGTILFDLDRMGSHATFEKNTIDSSGRGILLKASHVDVLDNWIRGGVSVNTEADSPSQANAGGNLNIRGNVFTPWAWVAGGLWDWCTIGAIAFGGNTDGARLFPHVTIENNTFLGIRGVNLHLSQTQDVSVTGNQFLQSHQVPPPGRNKCNLPPSALLLVRNSDDVRLCGNTMDVTGPYSTQDVWIEAASTSGILGVPEGLTVLSPSLRPDATKTYTLFNRFSGLSLTSTPTGVGQSAASGGNAQQWRLEQINTSNWYRVVNPPSGKVLTADTSGTGVTQATWNVQWTQMWLLQDTGHGTARLVNRSRGSALGTQGNVATSATVGQHPISGLLNQGWSVVEVAPAP